MHLKLVARHRLIWQSSFIVMHRNLWLLKVLHCGTCTCEPRRIGSHESNTASQWTCQIETKSVISTCHAPQWDVNLGS